MKILLLRITLASGTHLEAGTVQDVSDDDGVLLVRLGRGRGLVRSVRGPGDGVRADDRQQRVRALQR